jgi:hypothetical protein
MRGIAETRTINLPHLFNYLDGAVELFFIVGGFAVLV